MAIVASTLPSQNTVINATLVASRPSLQTPLGSLSGGPQIHVVLAQANIRTTTAVRQPYAILPHGLTRSYAFHPAGPLAYFTAIQRVVFMTTRIVAPTRTAHYVSSPIRQGVLRTFVFGMGSYPNAGRFMHFTRTFVAHTVLFKGATVLGTHYIGALSFGNSHALISKTVYMTSQVLTLSRRIDYVTNIRRNLWVWPSGLGPEVTSVPGFTPSPYGDPTTRPYNGQIYPRGNFATATDPNARPSTGQLWPRGLSSRWQTT